MTRKSSSTSTQQRSGGRKTGSSRSRSTSDQQSTRQSASGQRSSSQSGGNRSRNREQGQRQENNQDWGFAPSQRGSGEPYSRDERSFAGRDYDQGRERSGYQSQSGGRGFASMDPERRRELASRGGRASHGRSSGQEQDDRRFTREIDSYYGRGQNEPGYRSREDFRENDPRFDDRERFHDEGAYRSAERGSDRDDWRMNPREREDYAPSYRSFGGDSYRREEGYGDEHRGYGGGYEGSYREGARYGRDDEDRYYSGRGPRESEGGFSGSHRQQSSGGRSRSSSGSSRRRD